MSQHTPGPWEMSGDLIVGGRYVPKNPKAPEGQFQLGNVRCREANSGRYPWEPDYETWKANTKLICASPSLLESLELAEGFISTFEGDESQEGVEWLLETIRGSIKSAKGE